jgi:hypothetical protein
MASVMGTSHLSGATPCQDACACEVVQERDGKPVLLAVVSDGAGSATHSHLGSSAACAETIRLLAAHFASGLTVEDLTKQVCVDLILGVRGVLEEVAQGAGLKIRDLACTLAIAAAGEGRAAFAQVGDGVIVVSSEGDDNEYSWVFWPERGEYANTTTFLSQGDVTDHIQYDASSSRVLELAVMTDGIQSLVLDYKAQTAHAQYFRTMFKPLRSRGTAGVQLDLCKLLGDHLGSDRVNERTDDDKTLILASRYPVP